MTTTREPVALGALAAAILQAVTAVVALIVAFGRNLTPEQQAAVVAVAVAVLGVVQLVAAKWQRSKVTPTVDPRTDDGVPLVPSDEEAVI